MMTRLITKTGRPSKLAAQRLGHHVIEVADALFIEKGYAGTSMATVALRARIGKQTLYGRYPDKGALFREVIKRRVDRMISAVEETRIEDPLAELKALGRAALTNALDPEFVTLNRVIIAESYLFPELACLVTDQWRSRFVDRCAGSIRRAQDVGACKCGDANAIAHMFLWGLVGAPLHRRLIGEQPLVREVEYDGYLETAWQLFLYGLVDRDGPLNRDACSDAGH